MKNQNYTSACTSINAVKIPALFNMDMAINLISHKSVLDIGGGKYDNAAEYVSVNYGAAMAIYDPYNRPEEMNAAALAGTYDVATVSNVLNVIDTAEARRDVVALAASKAPVVLITVYEGSRSGVGHANKAGTAWQENRKTADYVEEVSAALPETWTVERHGKLIVCQAPETGREIPAEEKQEAIAAHLHVSKRNSKLGNIRNMSLTPGVSCSPEACKTCHVDGCYAMDSYNLYPDVRTAWNDNTDMALYELDTMQECFMRYFAEETGPNKRKPMKYFRIHVGGDFITSAYAMMWFHIAEAFPQIHFLAFTKQFKIIRNVPFYTLPNFTLRLSDWPGIEIPQDLRELYPVAWMDDGTRPADTFPKNCLDCPGHCEDCLACFAREVGDTKFVKHGSKAKKNAKKGKRVKK